MNFPAFTIFGEVLFDNFPDGSRILGGAPFNVAWHLQALGWPPLFVSRVGEDEPGREILAAMQKAGMSRSGMQIDASHPTGSVAITFNDSQPSYQILDQQAYDYINSLELQTKPHQGLLYHGTLAMRNPVSRDALSALKRRWQGPVFLDVNLRAPWWQADSVMAWIDGADWLKLNDEELAMLLPGEHSIDSKMRVLQHEHQLQGVVVTRGSQGALALDSTGALFAVAPDADVEVVDTVGAGDAFAAVLMLGIAEQWPLAVTLERAQAFASALVGRRGAIVTEPAFYQTLVAGWR